MHLYTSDLLLKYNHPSSLWEANDSLDLYNYNLEHQPADWYYRNNSVEYNWNANGYRASEWAEIDWANSHVLMGCSYAMGLGVAEEDTITRQIANGVNLGQCGTSVQALQYNTIRLLACGIRPKSVKIIVPNIARFTYWSKDTWHDVTPAYLESKGDQLRPYVRDCYSAWLAQDPNAEQQGYMTALSLQALWLSAGVACDMYQHWTPQDPSFNIGIPLPDPIDLARDLNPNGFAHPGRLTLKEWADVIYGQ